MTWAKILQFGIKNWRELVVIACLSLVTLKTQMDYRALNKAYEISRQEMELQISSLRDIHAEELRQREEAIESYRAAMEEIQQNYLASVADALPLKGFYLIQQLLGRSYLNAHS